MALVLRRGASIPITLSLLDRTTRAPLSTVGAAEYNLTITPGSALAASTAQVVLNATSVPPLTLAGNLMTFRPLPNMFAAGLWSWEATIFYSTGPIVVSDPGDLLVEA
jgi:hypothetical protein